MSDPDWAATEALFHEAAQRPREEWASFLDQACSDVVLRRQVARLLEQDAEAERYFGELAGRAAVLHHEVSIPAAIVAGGESLAGRVIGGYRLEREIGRGGTSFVYLAHRADGAFRRAVAVKVLARQACSADLVRRFAQEQQLLSELEHPNIARFYDGGVTADGLSYFVMEWVDGHPIDRYCDDRRLGIRERLRLFLDVADAVEHAHRHLIIHRDLKPSNIMVAGDGTVKLLDFGIAKILAGEHAGTPGLTQTGTRWMTPDYAAPEQVRGERTTTATDVYQLGVVLYRLLCGHHPYAAGAAGPAYLLERAVCETEPRAPSRALLQEIPPRPSRDAAAVVAAQRAATPGQLRKALAGDLDSIVLRALQKEHTQRYGTAEALARDVRRHLAGQPVEARQGTLVYRTRKFVARHRVAAGGAALALLVLGATSTMYVVQIGRERDRAQLEARKAGEVAQFLVGLFQASDPRESPGTPVTAMTLLERGVEQANELEGQPAVQAEMLHTIAHAYFGLGQLDAARAMWERSLDIRRRNLPAGHPDIAHSLAHIGWVWLVGSEFVAAAEHFESALAIQRAALGPEHAEVANSLAGLGLAQNGLGDTGAAETNLRHALRIRRKLYDGPHAEVANGLHDLAIVLRTRGDIDAAVPLQREALQMRLALLHADDPAVAAARKKLGFLLLLQGDYPAAEPLLLEAHASLRHTLGERHPRTRSAARELVRLYSLWARPAEAAVYQALSLD
jgi:eukaryotic-like serine/threonine-protein kinase